VESANAAMRVVVARGGAEWRGVGQENVDGPAEAPPAQPQPRGQTGDETGELALRVLVRAVAITRAALDAEDAQAADLHEAQVSVDATAGRAGFSTLTANVALGVVAEDEDRRHRDLGGYELK